jgi:predicted dehydrogenase
MRFHPGPAMVQSLLGQGRIGRILFARIHTGSYLPNWRPRQDYTQSYSAKSAMGGGCILDCIHELDLARWYLGEVDEVYCVAEHLSSLHIDVEDVAMLVCRHRDGMLSEIHLDYVQHTYERGCQIVGEQGAIFWDFARGEVRLFDADGDVWETFAQPEGWEINQMYIDELHHLLACLRGEVTSTLPIPEALDVMRLALGAKASARAGTPVKTRSVF